MKFGVFDHMDHAGTPLGQLYADRLQLLEAYDRAGLHGYHLAEHHSTPLGCAASPGLFLAAAAQRTRTLRFGPLVYLLPFYHPLRLIEEICMLDHMSGGRLELGVGRGVSPFETKAYGLDFAHTGEIYHEAFQLILKGLASDELTFEGKHYQFRNVPMILRPVQRPHPPLWYGTTIPENADWPAAKDVNIVTIALRPTVRLITDRYRAVRARLGKAPTGGPFLGVARHVVVADTDEAALAVARRAYPHWRDSSAGCSHATAPSRGSRGFIRPPSTSWPRSTTASPDRLVPYATSSRPRSRRARATTCCHGSRLVT